MDNNKTSKIILVVLSIGLVISALVSVTYALFSNDVYAANPDVYSTGLLSIETNAKSEKISLTNVLPITDEEGLASTPYIFTIKNVGNLDYKFNVQLLADDTGENEVISSQYVKIQVDDGEVTTLYDLNNTIKSDITLYAGESIDISIRVWLSIDLENEFYNTPNTEMGKSFESNIVIDGQAVYTSTNDEIPLIELIESLYLNADKSIVSNNSINYNYASSVSLMNDRLGGTTTDLDGGNIRYYGGTPNNYIDIGDRDSNGNIILYRIIGLFRNIKLADGTFQDLVKVVRDKDIGGFSWDFKSDGTYVNDWNNATLNTLLNNTYYNSGTINYYNDSTTATAVNFSSSGLSESARNKIVSVNWKLGGYPYVARYSNQLYAFERGNEVYGENSDYWVGKIALIYPSDYGYATDFNDCNSTLYEYGNSSCYGNDYLYSGFDYWTLTTNSKYEEQVWRIAGNGKVYSGTNYNAGDKYIIRPTFYLHHSLKIVSGTGTDTEPYVVK